MNNPQERKEYKSPHLLDGWGGDERADEGTGGDVRFIRNRCLTFAWVSGKTRGCGSHLD
jgi:hypothetical protein